MCLNCHPRSRFVSIARFFWLALAITNGNLTQHHCYPWMLHRDQSFLHSSISFMKTPFRYVKIERKRRAIAPCTTSQSRSALVSSWDSRRQMPILRTIESKVCFSAEVTCALRGHAQTLFSFQSSRFRMLQQQQQPHGGMNSYIPGNNHATNSRDVLEFWKLLISIEIIELLKLLKAGKKQSYERGFVDAN